MNDIYDPVENWTDLIGTNIAFLNGTLNETFYHCEPLDNETTDDQYFLNDIIKLNMIGVFTFNSQPYIQNKQKSYISCHINRSIGDALFDKLQSNENIYFCFLNNGDDYYYDNIPQEKLNLSRTQVIQNSSNIWHEYTNWKRCHYFDGENILQNELEGLTINNFPKIYNLIKNTIFVMIISKSFTNDISAPKILLNCVNEIAK